MTGYRNEQRPADRPGPLQESISSLSAQASCTQGTVRTLIALIAPALRSRAPEPVSAGPHSAICNNEMPSASPNLLPSTVEKTLADIEQRLIDTMKELEDAISRVSI
jgi:hypothetical protein